MPIADQANIQGLVTYLRQRPFDGVKDPTALVAEGAAAKQRQVHGRSPARLRGIEI